MLDNLKNMNEIDEAKVTEDLRKGSAEAFQILYRKYHNKVYRFCLRMLGTEAAAKDAFQETFIKVYDHRHEFRGDNFGAWLFTIARRVCLNALRTKKEFESFEEVFYNVGYENHSDVGVRDQINKAIALLPVQLREAFILRDYNECSYQEIAGILGIDLSLAKVRVHRARMFLRKILNPVHKELYES
jgi:RNA polymerase sigma-70 factor, ECF subfamily